MTTLLSVGAVLAGGSLLTVFVTHLLAERKLKVPSFFLGLVHGLVSPFALIASAFGKISVYSSPNSGSWYDLGFALGCAVVWSAITSA
jgi:hypothetical protein